MKNKKEEDEEEGEKKEKNWTRETIKYSHLELGPLLYFGLLLWFARPQPSVL